jgi:hypothetical protein
MVLRKESDKKKSSTESNIPVYRLIKKLLKRKSNTWEQNEIDKMGQHAGVLLRII